VLTDVVMPGMNGREMITQLVKERPRVKVIYLSGYADEAVTQHGELEHGDAFLQKPFRMSDLANRVRTVLDS
jgi:DNA-binding response OmpR family regulator